MKPSTSSSNNQPAAKLLILSSAMLLAAGCNETPVPSEPEVHNHRPVQVLLLNESQQSNVRHFSGVLEATKTAHLAFKVPGTIEAILVNPGDKVIKGQVLANLDPHDYQVTVIELEARLAEANAAHDLAKAELARVKTAIADDAISQVNLDRANSGYKRSLAMVNVVTQNLQKAQDALDYTQLTAPFSGVIGAKNQQTFEQTAPGTALFSLHQLGNMKAVIDVPENLMPQLRSSQQALVTWHDQDKPLMASLSAMETMPDLIKQTYEVEFIMAQSTTALPGKAVDVAVTFENDKPSYCVPYGALVSKFANNSVYLVQEQKVIEQKVTVQSFLENRVCISGHLEQGDALVTAGVHYLKPNQLVTKTVAKAFSY
ncbi:MULTISPECIES: efflux RND transporter periplasmic adaptor subunit [unclassified Shewanella]|uniref:efflux RND transporter periplasmic adaptor subunit n=1 Tax=unclassified Shewanella TaxID=196818 RepID=UPI001BC22D92|nr:MULTISPECIES: efflux RND transporter periplasmic adaptor subunit [unclassified Shewanella]GIU15732.1 hemolysin D [Shewanella sp. MBTL60-112-B1]GIU40594.1 hemolysin D [Shewanella sp. MBTL60-112-B2]